MSDLPKALADTLTELTAARWSYRLAWDRDSGRNLFVRLEAAPFWGGPLIRATWHTRGTGTLRLFSCMIRDAGTVQYHDTSLKQARALIAPEPVTADA